ncbi:MAG: hypothetical protein LUH02_03605 [Erysipelotrichaceae bacterium]|nr:hypothetical protein [Erysipelotrichaceae bacterium]
MILVLQILITIFLGIIAVCAIVFPILFLSQRKKQHHEFMDWLEKYQHKD